jgi:hypothetical protein
MELIIFILICYGTTNIVTNGRIFEPLRFFLKQGYGFKMLYCSMCVGFWVGLMVSLLSQQFNFVENRWINNFSCGVISSGTSYILCVLFGDEGLRWKTSGQKKEHSEA